MKMEEYIQAGRLVQNITRLKSAIASICEEIKILDTVTVNTTDSAIFSHDRELTNAIIQRTVPSMYSADVVLSPRGLAGIVSITLKQLSEIRTVLVEELADAERDLDDIGRTAD